MTSILKELHGIGFNPLSSVLLVFVLSLTAYIKVSQGKQDKMRETWHGETRLQVEKLENKVSVIENERSLVMKLLNTCEEDNARYEERVKALSGTIEAFQACRRHDCPFRNYRPIPL